MSVRPKDAFEAAQSFSLRDTFSRRESAPATPVKNGLTFNLSSIHDDQKPQDLPPQLQNVQQLPKGMNFRLQFHDKQQQQQQQPPEMKQLTFSSMRKQTPLLAQGAALFSREQESAKADVMRLTAYVDELTNRLQKTQSRLEQTEVQLTRTSQVLCKERQVADRTLSSYKHSLAAAHQTEEKMRAEISANKKKTALQETTFVSSVEAAVASDEQVRTQQRTLDELETKVKALGEFKTTLEVEVAKLTSLRDSAQKSFEEMKGAHSAESAKFESVSAELTDARREFETTKQENAKILKGVADLKIEEATVREGVASLKSSRIQAEEETSSCRSALQAMLLEHGNVARKLSLQQEKLVDLETREKAAVMALVKTERKLAEVSDALPVTSQAPAPCISGITPVSEECAPSVPAFTLEATGCALCASEESSSECASSECASSECGSDRSDHSDDEPIAPPMAPRLAPKRRARVTGAVAPDRALCTNFGLPVPHSEQSRVAAVAAIDSPINMTLRRVCFVGSQHALLETTGDSSTGEAASAQDLMINAVVTDLKQKLTEISQSQPVFRLVAPLA